MLSLYRGSGKKKKSASLAVSSSWWQSLHCLLLNGHYQGNLERRKWWHYVVYAWCNLSLHSIFHAAFSVLHLTEYNILMLTEYNTLIGTEYNTLMGTEYDTLMGRIEKAQAQLQPGEQDQKKKKKIAMKGLVTKS